MVGEVIDLSDSKDKFILQQQSTSGIDTDVISIRIPHTLTERLDEASQKSGYSRNQVIMKCCEFALERLEIEHK